MKKIPGDINRGSAILTAALPKKLCQASGSVPIIVFCGLIFISMKNAVIFGGDSILVICQELFVIDFDMFFRKKVTLTDLRYALHETECQFDSILYSASSFSPVYSWFLTSNPKTSRTNLRDVSASALLC